MKGSEEVISEFNEYVNMTAEELEEWLKSDDSNSAGWPKDDGEGEGETVGHDSGRKIVEILKENPDKDPEKYTDEQVEHMRKVVAYCKRHLAQEAKGNGEKSEEEVKETKSYASLKNWGHDFLKAQDEGGEEKADDEAEEAEGEQDEEPAKAGDKRKKSGDQNGSSKKRETRQGEGTATKDEEKNGGGKGEEEEEEEEVSEEDPDDDDGAKAKAPKKGDTVSWKWGNGQPEGKVLDVKEEKTTITTKKGNEVTRDGKPEDPAVVIDTGSSKAIKASHELN